MRGRSYSYSPSPPPRGYSRRRRSPSPRGRYRGRLNDPPTSLLVRNLSRACRPEDLRGPFGEFGPIKDIYLPRDYYTGYVVDAHNIGGETVSFNSCMSFDPIPVECCREPRGFGFVQFLDPADAADAKYEMDGQVLLGRELTVVFAEENRKKPSEMRARERVRSRGRSSLSYSRSPRYRRSYSRSPHYARAYSHSPDYYSPPQRKRYYSRSISPRERRYTERSYSRSPYSSPIRSRSRSHSRSFVDEYYSR